MYCTCTDWHKQLSDGIDREINDSYLILFNSNSTPVMNTDEVSLVSLHNMCPSLWKIKHTMLCCL